MITPAGAPASASSAASSNAVSGVSCAGLSTTVQPAASAGPILRVAIAAGKFHGVSSSATPTGLRNVRIRFAPDGAVRSSPPTRTASSANQRKNSAAYVASARASVKDLPISSAIRYARSSLRALISSNVRRSTSPRSRGAVAAHAGCAPAAAEIAALTSSAPARGTVQIASPVDGFNTSKLPFEPSRHSPPMNCCVGVPTGRVMLLPPSRACL